MCSDRKRQKLGLELLGKSPDVIDLAQLVAASRGENLDTLSLTGLIPRTLGIANQKKGDLPWAKECAMRALAADPRNPVALKNLSAIFGKEGASLKALYHLRRSNECDPPGPQTVYGLAYAYMELGDIEQAREHFQMVLEMEAAEDLRGLARNELPEIAARCLKARGARMHAVFYLPDVLRLFHEVAGGDPGDHLRDRDAGAARAGHQ